MNKRIRKKHLKRYMEIASIMASSGTLPRLLAELNTSASA